MTLHSFTVDDEFRFLNKTIAQSHLGEKYDGIVVAIERNNELIPLDKDTAFQLGDLVWMWVTVEKIEKITVSERNWNWLLTKRKSTKTRKHA